MEMGFVSMVEPVLRCRSFFWGPTPGPDSRLKDFVLSLKSKKLEKMAPSPVPSRFRHRLLLPALQHWA